MVKPLVSSVWQHTLDGLGKTVGHGLDMAMAPGVLGSSVYPNGWIVQVVNCAVPTHTPGYQAAVDAGAAVRARIMTMPEMLNSCELARRMGVARETVNRKRRKGTLLALAHETRHRRYPTWQLEPRVMDVMPRLLKVLGKLNPWTQYLFITQRNPALNAASPLDVLRSGEQSRVLAIAAEYAESIGPA